MQLKVVTIILSLSYFYVFHMLNHLQTVKRSSTSHLEIVSGYRIGWILCLSMLLNILWLQNEQLPR